MRPSPQVTYTLKLIKRLIILVFLVNCAQEEAVPVTANFSLQVLNDDYSVPVLVKIRNHTSGADTYEWRFEGAQINTASQREPEVLRFEEPGVYTLQLEASNTDGSLDRTAQTITIDPPVHPAFEYDILINDFAPATLNFTNTSTGAVTFRWEFEGGIPESATEFEPEDIVFPEAGDHTIILTISNGREAQSIEKTVTLKPVLKPDFSWVVAPGDEDLQVPVQIQMVNNSVSALEFEWRVEGANPSGSELETPVFIFDTPGSYALILTATNGKETKTLTKELVVFEDTNLRAITDLELGVNTAHNQGNIGAFVDLDKSIVYTQDQFMMADDPRIDLVFFGLGPQFEFNKFYAPNNLENTSFEAIPNARSTIIINSLEHCGCGIDFTAQDFDAMTNDGVLQEMDIVESVGGNQHFTDAQVPRIVLFETQEGRKGALKIKRFRSNGADSSIVVDIKIQKEPK